MFWQSVSTKAEANTASSAKLAANNVQEVSSDGSGLTGPLFSELLSSLIAGIEDPKIQAALNSQNQTFDLGASFPGAPAVFCCCLQWNCCILCCSLWSGAT